LTSWVSKKFTKGGLQLKHDEDTIQASVCLALSALGVYFFAVPNSAAGKTTMQRAMRLKAMGVRAGVADLVIMGHGGQACFLEIKTESGRLSESQKTFRDLCQRRGWPWGIARSVDEAISFCRAWAII
jgi:hypothetical protein